MKRRLIIEGVTEDGRTFRPSDWIERISGSLSSFGNDRRMRYSNYVQPEICDGKKCLVVDTALRDRNPTQFNFLIDFARGNRLRVREIDTDTAAQICTPAPATVAERSTAEASEGVPPAVAKPTSKQAAPDDTADDTGVGASVVRA